MKFILDERFILNEDDTVSGQDVTDKGTAATPTAPTEQMPKKLSIPTADFWGEYYKTCKTREDFDSFWNGMSEIPADLEMSQDEAERKAAGFYRYEFGNNADAVKKLRYEFSESIETYGWVNNRNPMLSFLHYAFPKTGNAVLNVSPDDFAILWESLKKGILKQGDLLSIEKARLKGYNLIYNNNFYGISSAEQRGYLKLQERIINSQIAGVDSSKKPIVFANIYSTNGNLENAFAQIARGGHLRKLVEAEQVVDDLLGEEDKDVEAGNEQVAAIIKQIKSKDQAAKMLSYLVDAFSINYGEVIKAVDKRTGGKIFAQRNKTSSYPSRSETETFIKLLGGKNIKYNAAVLGELLLKLAEVAEIYTPEK